MYEAKRELAIRRATATLRLADKSRVAFTVLSLFQWPIAWWYLWGFWRCALGYAVLIAALIALPVEMALLASGAIAFGGLVIGWCQIGAARRLVEAWQTEGGVADV